MTEVEKLRALLAEAVPLNTPCPSCLRTIEEERQGYGRDGCVHTKRRLLVDAALAEPVVGCARCEETEHAMHLRIRSGYDKTIADSWRAKVAEVERERDEARAELDFIKAEYGGEDDESLTRDALLLKLRLLESEMDAERASRRMYERAHDDILEALKRAAADAYHPEDGEPVALWGVKRLAKERDKARSLLRDVAEACRGLKPLSDEASTIVGPVMRKRDEARAEIERLRGVDCGVMERNGATTPLCGICLECAFLRGAKAMREEAAIRVDGEGINVGSHFGGIIRALPIPEDEP